MTKAKTKRTVVRALAIVLAVLMPLLTTVIAFAEPETGVGPVIFGQKKYVSPDINALTGHGEEPEEISVSATATYQEKAWYEYVTYSDHAVCSYRLNDDQRILFYDPYTYTNSMIMDVQFDATTTTFDTMSEYSISHSTSKSIISCVESTYTSSSAVQTSGRDETGSDVTNGGKTHTKYNYDEINKTTGTKIDKTEYVYDMREYDTKTTTLHEDLKIASATGLKIKAGGISLAEAETNETITIDNTNGRQDTTVHHVDWYTKEQNHSTDYNDYTSTTTHDYEYDVEDNTTSKTEGWTQLSARVTKTLGSSSATSNSWAEEESTTVTRTYAATHFASDGVTPLPWAIVHYTVQMPMKCCLQTKYSGEWVTVATVFCLLTTVQGTCRAWMQNGQVYYEDWGNGEPVVATDFWSQFMTKDQLVQAYQNKLYPVGGEE